MTAQPSVAIDALGAECSVIPTRAKRQAPGQAYDGALHPCNVPEIPPNRIDEGKPAIVWRNGEGADVTRHLAHQCCTAAELFQRAADHALSDGGVAMLDQPLRGFVEALRRHPHLPDEVQCRTTGRVMSRDRWLLQGITVTRPAPLTDAQREQLLRAAFWSHERGRHAGVLAYYAAAGHTVVAKRPYRKRKHR